MTTVVEQRLFKVAAAPERSLAQRMDALERANEVRTKRAAVKREVKAGTRAIGAVLARPPAEVESMKVFDLLMTVPKVGRVKVNRMLREVDVSPSKTVAGLSPRQRQGLLMVLGVRAGQT